VILGIAGNRTLTSIRFEEVDVEEPWVANFFFALNTSQTGPGTVLQEVWINKTRIDWALFCTASVNMGWSDTSYAKPLESEDICVFLKLMHTSRVVESFSLDNLHVNVDDVCAMIRANSHLKELSLKNTKLGLTDEIRQGWDVKAQTEATDVPPKSNSVGKVHVARNALFTRSLSLHSTRRRAMRKAEPGILDMVANESEEVQIEYMKILADKVKGEEGAIDDHDRVDAKTEARFVVASRTSDPSGHAAQLADALAGHQVCVCECE
jgi:hypothetical protein